MNNLQKPLPAAGLHALHKVNPDQAAQSRRLVQARLEDAAASEGFLLATVTAVTVPDGQYLNTQVTFASAQHRAAWLAKAPTAQIHGEQRADGAEYEGPVAWIDVNLADCRPQMRLVPPKWKMAIVSWLTIFPTLTTFLLVTSPLLQHLHLVGRIFVNTLLIAPLMTWVLMPMMTRVLRPWLFAKAS